MDPKPSVLIRKSAGGIWIKEVVCLLFFNISNFESRKHFQSLQSFLDMEIGSSPRKLINIFLNHGKKFMTATASKSNKQPSYSMDFELFFVASSGIILYSPLI